MNRRAFLSAWAALAWAPLPGRAAPASSRLAAAWQAGSGYQVGILETALEETDAAFRIIAALDVPTRAHALLREPDGNLLAVARRPGDWLLRWSPEGRPLAWRWIEPRRAFTGHVVSDGVRLYVTETDLDTGAGLIGVRDARSLEKLAEWPTHGIDPHQLVWDALPGGMGRRGAGATGSGALLVANGGVPTRPESGRLKTDLARMDSSLVRLDADSGELLGQWRLADRRLSLRHLAWNQRRLGIALQAEHDDPAQKAAAPVLAIFDGQTLETAAAPITLAGYGGDVAPLEDGFAVSCPRAGGIARFGPGGAWQGLTPLVEACALAATPSTAWAGGRGLAWRDGRLAALPEVRLDNHWIAL